MSHEKQIMSEETKAKLRDAGREDLIETFELNQEGYVGCLPGTGMLVDRRKFPEAIPVPKNAAMGIPEPKKIEKEEMFYHDAGNGLWFTKVVVKRIVRNRAYEARLWVKDVRGTAVVYAETTIAATSADQAIEKTEKFLEIKLQPEQFYIPIDEQKVKP